MLALEDATSSRNRLRVVVPMVSGVSGLLPGEASSLWMEKSRFCRRFRTMSLHSAMPGGDVAFGSSLQTRFSYSILVSRGSPPSSSSASSFFPS